MRNQIVWGILGLSVGLFLTSCGGLQPVSGSSGATSSKEASLRKDIVQYAKKYEGTKYKYAGRSPKGFDCSGFTHYVMDEFGIAITPVSRVQETEGKVISLKQAKAGDLIFFRKTKAGKVFHVSLVVANTSDGLYVIHSTSSRGVVIDNITQNSYWNKKIATARDVINR